jgi:hypothetical protein
MKKTKLIFASMMMVVAISGCSGDNAEDAASGAVSKVVEIAKGAATGVDKGVEEGRKKSNSADGAVIVSNSQELSAALTGEVLEAKAGENIDVSMAFTNAGVAPVRVTDLSLNNHVTALDADDFACTTQSNTEEFTVPAKAKLKVALQFNCDGKAIAKVRLFETEYAVAKEKIVAAK